MPSLITTGGFDFYLHTSIPEVALVPLLACLAVTYGSQRLADKPFCEDASVRVADEIPERPVLESTDLKLVILHADDPNARHPDEKRRGLNREFDG